MSAQAWHAGERAVQQRVGVQAQMAQIGPRVLRSFMPQQHRVFFGQLPFLLAGSVDATGQPWASVLAAPPGFITSPDPRTLRVQAMPMAGDPLCQTLVEGAAVGLLGLEPHTRRRNRANGRVQQVGAAGFEVHIDQSFGNCPKYIQARQPLGLLTRVPGPDAIHLAPALDEPARRLIEKSDTLFIATAYPGDGEEAGAAGGADVSHRGGRSGFVRVDGDGSLTMPDFAGNYFFNTLGNLAINPRAGLLFIDFEQGDLLYLAVTADIVWEGPEVDAFAGAQRLVRFKVHAMRRLEAALPWRWGAAEQSPVLAMTGDWT